MCMCTNTYVGAAQGRSPCFPCPSRGGATPTPSRHSTLFLAGSSPSPVSSSTSSVPRLLLPQKPKSSDARGPLWRALVHAPGVWGEGRGWSGARRGGQGWRVRGVADGFRAVSLGHTCLLYLLPSIHKDLQSIGAARAGSRRRGLYPVVVYKMVQIARGVVKWLRSRAVSAC